MIGRCLDVFGEHCQLENPLTKLDDRLGPVIRGSSWWIKVEFARELEHQAQEQQGRSWVTVIQYDCMCQYSASEKS